MSTAAGSEQMREVFTQWLKQLADRLARTTDGETVALALAQADPLSGLSLVLERVSLLESTLRDPLVKARARGIGGRERLIEQAGGALRLAEAAKRLGVTPQAVSARRGRGTILAVPLPNGEWVYPAVQFTEAGLLQGLDEVLRAFQDVSPWGQLAALVASSRRFGGRSAIELLEGGDVHAARSIAATYGEQG